MLQELLALSTALSATLTAQLAFDSKHLKYCSTYNLAEAVDKNMKKGIYHLGDAYELAVTPRKTNWYSRGLIGKYSRWNLFTNIFAFLKKSCQYCDFRAGIGFKWNSW